MGILWVKIGILTLAITSIYLLFSNKDDVGKGNLVFTLITVYIYSVTYINYSMVGENFYGRKAFILFLALIATIANLVKEKSFITSRFLINLSILMNLYFLLV